MKRFAIVAIVAATIASVAVQAHAQAWQEQGDPVRFKNRVLFNAPGSTIEATCPETHAGDQTSTGARTQSGRETLSGPVALTPASVTLTNGAVITPTTAAIAITPRDVDAGGPITNAIAAPGAAGIGKLLLLVNAGPTNVVIADSGNVNLTGAATLGADDSLLLYAPTAAKWVSLGIVGNN